MPKRQARRKNFVSVQRGFTLIRTLLYKNLVNAQQGFTLIELMVVVVTMAILFGLGVANYRSFAGRKTLEQAGVAVRNELKLAKEYALTGKKPSPANPNCEPPNYLDGYVFVNAGVISGIQNYRIEADCSVGANVVVKPNAPFDVYGVTFSMASRASNCTAASVNIASVRFETLGHGVDIASGSCVEITFAQAGTSNTYRLTIDSSGTIK